VTATPPKTSTPASTADDIQQFVAGTFAQQPFAEYRNYFNIRRVDVISAQSGADHPEIGVFKNTALDATYNCSGIQRLVCVNTGKVNSVITASGIPATSRDMVLVIVNDPQYGGSGGAIAVASTNSQAVELILHEGGHSFGLLADEYGGPPPPSCVTSEPVQANATRQTSRLFIKWAAWIDPSTPVLATSSYWVQVSNPFGTADSNTATLAPIAGAATYDATFKVPRCSIVGSSCDSFDLLTGKGTMTNGVELNQPNTINNSCTDGSFGVFHANESIDRIRVSTLDGTPIAPGKFLRVDVTFYAFSNGDRLDIFVSGSATTPLWSQIATLWPEAGLQTLSATYMLGPGNVQAVRALLRWDPNSEDDNTNPCIPSVNTDHDDLIFAVGGATGTELVQNGDFASGRDGWNVWELPDIVHNSGAGGVFEFHKADPATTASGQAVVFQETGQPIASGAPLVAQFELGNADLVRKRISVLVIDSNFSDLSVCTFWLPPNAPMRAYQMRTHTNRAWANASIYFYAASPGLGNYRLDNVSLRRDPDSSATSTQCLDPTTPSVGGAASSSLLMNGGFSAGLSGWGPFFDLVHNSGAGGVFEFIRPGTPGQQAGGLLQSTGQGMAANQLLSATFHLGNSSNVRKRVTILLHDADFTDLSACTFWLPAGQALLPYSMRAFTTREWSNATLSVYAATVGPEQATQLDNVTFQRASGVMPLGTECVEPTVLSMTVLDPGATARSGRSARSAPLEQTVAVERATAATNGRANVAVASGARPMSGEVQASVDGVTWMTVAMVDGSDAWPQIEIDLSQYTGATIYLRFVFDGAKPALDMPPIIVRRE